MFFSVTSPQLRKHYSAHMPTTARPSILSIPLASPLISPSTGHARRKSVLASLTRTFTSPTSSRRGTPSLLSSAPSQASIAEHAAEEEEGTRPAGAEIRHPHVQEQQTVATSTQFPILHSQLSNLSDYLSSLSCIAEIRSSKQWNSFFKPTKEDHISSRLEPVASSTMASKGRRLKRMKSETGLETRSFISPSPVREGKTGAAQLETPERKEVRIDDSGIGTDALGHAATGPKGRNGHVMESSVTSTATSTSASVSASASTSMKREVSTGTNTSVSAMSLFIEHTEEEEEEVGDPEVLAYMQRLRQDSENRNNATADPFKIGSKKEVKMTPKQAVPDYVPPTPVSPAPRTDVDPPPPGGLPEAPAEDNIPIVNSPSDEPVLAALEESIDAELEEETAELPPLSGATAVDSTEQQERQQNQSLGQAMDDEPVHSQIINSPLLSPDSATNGAGEGASSTSTSKQKKSISSLRRRRKSSAANTNTTASHRARSSRTSIRIEDFEILRVLGKGCAGKVLLARLKDMTTISARGGITSNNALYAIKAIHKHHVLAHRELAHTLTEQSILRKMATEIPNPFIVLMNWSFQVSVLCLLNLRGIGAIAKKHYLRRIKRISSLFSTSILAVIWQLSCLDGAG